MRFILLAFISVVLCEQEDTCSDDNTSCLTTTTTTLATSINKKDSLILKGTFLVAPSGQRYELIERIGLLAENSPECLPPLAPMSSEVALRPVDFNKPRHGRLLLPPANFAVANRLRLAPPEAAATYFTGLDIAVLTPKPLSTRVENLKDEMFASGKHFYKLNEQYDKGSCGEVWRAKLKKRNNF